MKKDGSISLSMCQFCRQARTETEWRKAPMAKTRWSSAPSLATQVNAIAWS